MAAAARLACIGFVIVAPDRAVDHNTRTWVRINMDSRSSAICCPEVIIPVKTITDSRFDPDHLFRRQADHGRSEATLAQL